MIKNKLYLTVILITFFCIENIVIIFAYNWHQQNERFKEYLDGNAGITRLCNKLSDSESLFSVLEKSVLYNPIINKTSDDNLELHFGMERLGGAGVKIIFNKDLKMIEKDCGE